METSRTSAGPRSAIAVIWALAAACSGRPGPAIAPTPIAPAFTQSHYNSNREQVEVAARGAPLVFVGTVSAVGPAPGSWSGHFPRSQAVQYSNLRMLKGRLDRPTATVHHPVVAGAPTVDTQIPRLSGQIFAAGKLVIVIADYRNGRLESPDSRYGAMPHDAANEAAIKYVLKSP